MDLSVPRLSPGAEREPAASPGLTAAAGVSRLLECDADLDALDRMLLAFAVHPEGGAFTRAHLLVWNAERELLEGWRHAERSSGSPSLREGLEAARRAAPSSGEAERSLRACSLPSAALEGALLSAWSGAHTAIGDAGLTPGPWQGTRAIGAIALRRAGHPYGLLVGEWSEDPPRPDSLAAVRLLADAALDSQARAADLKRHSQHAAALAEFARSGISALNLAEALHLAARLAVQATRSRGSALWLAGGARGLELEVTHGPAAQRERIARTLQPLGMSVLETARARVVERPSDEALLSPQAAEEFSSLAVFPIAAYGQVLGVFAIYDRTAFHPAEPLAFDRAELAFLETLTDLIAAVLERAGRLNELERARQQHRDLAAGARHRERLAALGEMAARVAEEARNPLASIAAFARRVHRSFAEGDPNREYLEIVIRESTRLERLVEEQLQYATLESPRLKVQSLNAVVQEALQRAGESLVRRRVRLLKKLTPELPPLLLDAERIRRVVDNVLAHALETVPLGGRVRVESRRAGSHAVVEIAHDGARLAGELLDQLFVPFAASRTGLPTVGLGVAQQIVREHGGEIRVRSEGEWNSIFSFTLPIQDNQDRRHPGTERRHLRTDRRRRTPES